jgi:hypothetical protein
MRLREDDVCHNEIRHNEIRHGVRAAAKCITVYNGLFDIAADRAGDCRLTELRRTLNNYPLLFVDQSARHNLPMIHLGLIFSRTAIEMSEMR